MTPISVVNNQPERIYRKIKSRPIHEQGLNEMKKWLSTQVWTEVFDEESAHRKAEILQNLLVSAFEELFPEKVKKVANDDQPFINEKLKKMKRKKCREFQKHRRSEKWRTLEEKYQDELGKTKKDYYRRKIRNLRRTKPRNWHSEIKKLTSYDQQKSEKIVVEAIKDLPVNVQAELIADKFAAVSQEFEKLKEGDIKIPEFTNEEIPQFTESEVKEVLSQMDVSKSNVSGHIPARILKTFSDELAKPVTEVLNSSIK